MHDPRYSIGKFQRRDELADSRDTPIETSLTLLDALHVRWISLLRALRDDDFRRSLVHPDHGKVTLDWLRERSRW